MFGFGSCRAFPQEGFLVFLPFGHVIRVLNLGHFNKNQMAKIHVRSGCMRWMGKSCTTQDTERICGGIRFPPSN